MLNYHAGSLAILHFGLIGLRRLGERDEANPPKIFCSQFL